VTAVSGHRDSSLGAVMRFSRDGQTVT